jgi:putative glutamine amidotransferase
MIPRRVLVSQRRDVVVDRGEARDGLDQRWTGLLWSLGFLAVPVPNNPSVAAAMLEQLQPSAVLLSGGNDVRPASPGFVDERNQAEAVLLAGAMRLSLPALGVCRGFQMMNVHLGGSLVHTGGHVRTRHEWPQSLANNPGWCNSYHELAISLQGLARGFDAHLTLADGTVEAASCQALRWTGVMWHPERDNGSAEYQLGLVRAALEGREWSK